MNLNQPDKEAHNFMRKPQQSRKPLTLIARSLAVGALALSLMGCGGTDETVVVAPAGTPDAAAPTPDASGPAAVPADDCSVEVPCEISFRWWGGDDRQRRTLDVISLFEEQNPDVRILPMPTSLAGYYDQLLVEFAAGTAPDVFQLDASRPREFGAEGLLLGLNGLLDTTYLPQAQINEASYEGIIYAAPHTGNANSILLNTDLFAAAGVPLPDTDTWSWDDFIRIGEELSAGLPAGSWPLEIIPINFGRTWIAQRWQEGVFTVAGGVSAPPELFTEWLDFIQTLENDGIIPPATETAELFLVGPEESLMGQGRSAMMFAPSSTISQMTAVSGANLILGRVPGESTEPYVGTIIDVGIYYGISSRTEHPGAAVRFIDFMVNSPDAGLILGVDRGLPLNSQVAAALYETVDPVAQQQFTYIESVMANGGTAAPRSPGGWLNADVDRIVEAVLFGQMTPDVAGPELHNILADSIANAMGR